MTSFHTRGYLKIRMSHDEIVGNVLSWLGSWLRNRKQPKPTLLVTNSICSQPSACRKYGSFVNGKVMWGRPQKILSLVFITIFWKKILQSNLLQNAKLRKRPRDWPESSLGGYMSSAKWLMSLNPGSGKRAWEESERRLLSRGDEFQGILYHWAREPRHAVLSLNGKIFDKHLFRRKARGCLGDEVRLPQQLPISFQFSLEIQFNLEVACLPKENSAVYIPMASSDWLSIYHMF